MSAGGEVECSYCGGAAQLVGGERIYPHRPDLYAKQFYACFPCEAWVGCHPGTCSPLGRLANAPLRAAKSRAHAAFDPLWRDAPRRKRKGRSLRSEMYAWLAGHLGIDERDCHIGMFDEAMCDRVVEACRARAEGRADA